MEWLVLDTGLLLAGMDPPPGARWATTPEAAAEVRPGGRDARRFEDWRSIGLQVRSPGPDARARVDEVARAAGSLERLSAADRSLLALALEMAATLVTDDYTMLDVARRLDVPARTVQQRGVETTMDWAPRCAGCGRWFDEAPPGDECPVCGSAVRARPRR